jgi:hypothetical protein
LGSVPPGRTFAGCTSDVLSSLTTPQHPRFHSPRNGRSAGAFGRRGVRPPSGGRRSRLTRPAATRGLVERFWSISTHKRCRFTQVPFECARPRFSRTTFVVQPALPRPRRRARAAIHVFRRACADTSLPMGLLDFGGHPTARRSTR